MQGAKVFSSTLVRRALSASQLALSPSPSEVARPMPVIQTSLAGDAMASVMRQCLWKADLVGHRVHVYAQIGIGEGDMAEGQVGGALQLLAGPDLGRCNRKPRTFVLDPGFDRQQFAGSDEAPHLGFLHHR